MNQITFIDLCGYIRKEHNVSHRKSELLAARIFEGDLMLTSTILPIEMSEVFTQLRSDLLFLSKRGAVDLLHRHYPHKSRSWIERNLWKFTSRRDAHVGHGAAQRREYERMAMSVPSTNSLQNRTKHVS